VNRSLDRAIKAMNAGSNGLAHMIKTLNASFKLMIT
jgi:hypothetical protein